jgi:hypothetical protein
MPARLRPEDWTDELQKARFFEEAGIRVGRWHSMCTNGTG